MAESKKKKANRNRDIVKKIMKKDNLSDKEIDVITEYYKRIEEKPVKLENIEDSTGKITQQFLGKNPVLHVAKLMKAFGTPDGELQNYFLNQVVQTFRGCASSDGFNTESLPKYCNDSLAILQGISPKDEIEGMLAVQMIGVHNLAMETLKRAMITDQTFEGKETNVNHASKALRIFISQMEALKKYRTGGQQKMIVEHIHINKGGQAVIGNVSKGGGDGTKK